MPDSDAEYRDNDHVDNTIPYNDLANDDDDETATVTSLTQADAMDVTTSPGGHAEEAKCFSRPHQSPASSASSASGAGDLSSTLSRMQRIVAHQLNLMAEGRLAELPYHITAMRNTMVRLARATVSLATALTRLTMVPLVAMGASLAPGRDSLVTLSLPGPPIEGST